MGITHENVDFFLLDDFLTDRERQVRDQVRAFCDREVIPIIGPYWDRGEFPEELVPKLAQLGLAGGYVEGYGCPGLSLVAVGLLNLELARGDASVHTFFGVHSSMAMGAIGTLGSDEQKKRWLPAMARLEKIGAFALTEPEHGSDVAKLTTSARRRGDVYVINGEKRWIGNGTMADLIVVWARDDEGHVGGFVVEPGPGYDARPITGKGSQRAAVHAHIRLEDAEVPVENRLVGARTFRDASAVLLTQRWINAWEATGHALAAYEVACDYAQRREQFGWPLATFQLVQERLARMLASITTMQLLAWRVTQLAAGGRATPGMASMAKMENARRARRVIAEARDLLGGNGILLDNHIARHHADIEATYTYDGTDSIQALIIGREITGQQAFAAPPPESREP
jgi:glutaryl-CoA dehydrogenase